jgi:uncharacterized membrane protein YgdD (TMEM256/DUF423 family)
VQKTILVIAALAGLTAVVLGAFGAHGLKGVLTSEQLLLWEKGVQYQFYHALAIFCCAVYLRQSFSTSIRNAAYCFALGILFFSGSLYLLATREINQIPTFILGPITPLGGLFFIAGWAWVLLAALKK